MSVLLGQLCVHSTHRRFPQTVFRPPSAQSDEALGYSGGLPYQPAGSLTTSPQILQFCAFFKNFSPIQMEPSDDSVEAIRCCTFGSSIERTTEGIGFPRSNDDFQISTQGVGRANSSIIAVHLCPVEIPLRSVGRSCLRRCEYHIQRKKRFYRFSSGRMSSTDKKRHPQIFPPPRREERAGTSPAGGSEFCIKDGLGASALFPCRVFVFVFSGDGERPITDRA